MDQELQRRLEVIRRLTSEASFKILSKFFDGKPEDAPSRQALVKTFPEMSEGVLDQHLFKLKKAGFLQSERTEEAFYFVNPELDQWTSKLLGQIFEDCN